MADENTTPEHNTMKLVVEDGDTFEVTLLDTLTKGKTERGFGFYEFEDKYGRKCSLQDSSLASEPAIWLGVDNANPERLEKGKGWVPFPVTFILRLVCILLKNK